MVSRDFLFSGVHFWVWIRACVVIRVEVFVWVEFEFAPDFSVVGVHGGDVFVDADEDDFLSAVFSADVELFEFAFVSQCYFAFVADFVSA